MENFSNSVLIPENLPEIKPETFSSLDKKYKSIIYIRTVILLLIPIGAFISLLFVSEEKLPAELIITVISVIVFLGTCSIAITILGFPKKGYLVREKDISYQKGLITYKLISVPFNRIQHVEINQGILAKIFKLSSVKIFTAGGNASDLSIPGLPVEVAQKLKAFLSDKISKHE